jgi:Phytanoyl-CoA dioxygenase (PhyH)
MARTVASIPRKFGTLLGQDERVVYSLSLPDQERFRRHGWILLPRVFDADDLGAVIEAIDSLYPTGDAYADHPANYADLAGDQFAGVRWWPLADAVLDDLVVSPQLVGIARALIGDEDLRLLRAGYWAKYTGAADYTQVLHYDYPNHSLVVPDDDEIVGFFLYLSDIDNEDGATRLVSTDTSGPVTPDMTHLPLGHPLYDVECPAEGPLGSVLAYRSTTYHRGGPMTTKRGRRVTLNFAYGKPGASTGYQSWPRLGEDPGLVEFLRRSSPQTRTLLGFPPPDDPYWTPAAIDHVRRRYRPIDMTSYGHPIQRGDPPSGDA